MWVPTIPHALLGTRTVELGLVVIDILERCLYKANEGSIQAQIIATKKKDHH